MWSKSYLSNSCVACTRRRTDLLPTKSSTRRRCRTNWPFLFWQSGTEGAGDPPSSSIRRRECSSREGRRSTGVFCVRLSARADWAGRRLSTAGLFSRRWRTTWLVWRGGRRARGSSAACRPLPPRTWTSWTLASLSDEKRSSALSAGRALCCTLLSPVPTNRTKGTVKLCVLQELKECRKNLRCDDKLNFFNLLSNMNS